MISRDDLISKAHKQHKTIHLGHFLTLCSIKYAEKSVEFWVYKGVLSEAWKCRICSCDWDGSQCTRIGTRYGKTGRNVEDCGACDFSSVDASQACPA